MQTKQNNNKKFFKPRFSSIRPIARILSGATTPGQNGPGNGGSEGVVRIPRISSIHIQDTLWGGGLTPLQRCSLCIL